MEYVEELFHIAFDTALKSCDEALDAMNNGPKDDLQLSENYKDACLKIMLLLERWEREGHKNRHGELIDIWFKRFKEQLSKADV